MDDLMERKRNVAERHMATMCQSYIKILGIKQKAAMDKKLGVNVDVGILDKLKSLVTISSDKLLNMSGEERLQYGQQWSDDAKYLVEMLKNDPGYASLVVDYERQLRIYEEELKQINEELKECDDEQKRKELGRRKDQVGQLAS